MTETMTANAESPISKALHENLQAVNLLEEIVKELRSRLEPVLGSEIPKCEKEKAPLIPPVSIIEQRIVEPRERILLMRFAIEDILKRLQI